MSSKTETDAPKRRKRAPAKKAPPPPSALRMWLRLFARLTLGAGAALLALIVMFTVINPPTTPYQLAEGWRLSGVKQEWRALEEISPHMARSVIAAEDANFCLHWGFDMAAFRAALAEGEGRGASTISQQTVKNVFLWQGRSWFRKALEAGITPVAELVWTKRRMIEIYLNVAEFGVGVFGVEAAAQHYYGISARELSAVQAARLAALLPSPKRWSPDDAHVRQRAARIVDGAATIEADGRAACLGEL